MSIDSCHLLYPSVIPRKISWSSAVSTSSWKPEFPRHTQTEKCRGDVTTSFPKEQFMLSYQQNNQTAAEVKTRLMHLLSINSFQNSQFFLKG